MRGFATCPRSGHMCRSRHIRNKGHRQRGIVLGEAHCTACCGCGRAESCPKTGRVTTVTDVTVLRSIAAIAGFAKSTTRGVHGARKSGEI